MLGRFLATLLVGQPNCALQLHQRSLVTSLILEHFVCPDRPNCAPMHVLYAWSLMCLSSLRCVDKGENVSGTDGSVFQEEYGRELHPAIFCPAGLCSLSITGSLHVRPLQGGLHRALEEPRSTGCFSGRRQTLGASPSSAPEAIGVLRLLVKRNVRLLNLCVS